MDCGNVILFPEYLENNFFQNDKIIEEELMTDI